jgi:hypothetical protein
MVSAGSLQQWSDLTIWNHFQTLGTGTIFSTGTTRMVPVRSLRQWFRYRVYNNGSGTASTTMVPVPSLQQWFQYQVYNNGLI